MKKHLLWVSAALLLLTSACLQPLIGEPDCAASTISQADVDATLQLGDDLFPQAEWARKYSVAENYVYADWTHRSDYQVASINTLLLCDADLTVAKNYFSRATVDIIFSNYDSYELLTSCEDGDTVLFEFAAVDGDRQYNARIWAKPLDEPHRVLWALLVFPRQEPELMAEYGTELFPELTTCSE